MPQAFAGDGTEGQRAEKVDEENFRYVKELSFAEWFKLTTVAPIIYGGFGVAGQGDNILHGYSARYKRKRNGITLGYSSKDIK